MCTTYTPHSHIHSTFPHILTIGGQKQRSNESSEICLSDQPMGKKEDGISCRLKLYLYMHLMNSCCCDNVDCCVSRLKTLSWMV